MNIRRSVTLAILLVTCSSSIAATREALICDDPGVRQRATVSSGTLLSDKGTPLRGIRYSLDIPNRPPAAWLIASLPGRGMNALHVYAEKPEAPKAAIYGAGYNAAALDIIVNEAAQNGLYVVITVGGEPSGREQYSKVFTRSFWQVYASRYAGRTHVIYEIQNEPYYHHPNGNADRVSQQLQVERVFQAEMYEQIRSAAPDTPILLFSYAFLHDASAVLADVAEVERLAPRLMSEWSKTAIAFHGYAGETATSATLDALQGARTDLGFIETELANPYPQPLQGLYLPLVQAYEQRSVSWLSFMDFQNNLDLQWNGALISNQVTWVADCGSFSSLEGCVTEECRRKGRE